MIKTNIDTTDLINPIQTDTNLLPGRPMRFFMIAVSVLSILFSIWLSARLAVHTMYTGFQSYDDEGAMLITLEQMHEGHPLYDQVVSMYGPLGFLPKLALVNALHLTVNHDTGRAISLFIWMLTSIVSGAAVWRITGMATWCAVGISAVCFVLMSTAKEPGHPQDLCSLWIAMTLLTATYAHRQRFAFTFCLLGIAAGFLTLTKINLGIFCVVPISLAMLNYLPRGKIARIIFYVAALFSLVMPVILMRGAFTQPSVVYFCAEVVLSLLACLIVVATLPVDPCFSLAGVGIWGATFSATLIAGCLATMSAGTSFHGLAEGIVFLPLKLSKTFALRLPIEGCVLPQAILGLLFAIFIGTWFRLSPADDDRRRRVISIVQIIAGISALTMLCTDDLPELFFWIPPLAWLILVPNRSVAHREALGFARTFLAFLAVMELLWAYPVAGSQLAFSLFPLTILSVVTLGDGISGLSSLRATPRKRMVINWSLGCISVFAVLLFDAVVGNEMTGMYQGLTPMKLYGSNYVRVTREQASDLEDVVATVQANADALFTLPGMNSFYFWARLSPPTSSNVTSWTNILTDQQQRDIIHKLSGHPLACMIYDKKELAFWLKDAASSPDGPLLDYLQAHFSPIVDIGSYQILVRTERPTMTLVRGTSNTSYHRGPDRQWIPDRKS